MVRRPSRRTLLGLAVLVLLIGAVVWQQLHARRQRALARDWEALVARAADPAPQPPGTVTATRFAKALARHLAERSAHGAGPTADDDLGQAAPFVAWLTSPGPHHLRTEVSPGLDDRIQYSWDPKDMGQIVQQILLNAGRHFAASGDPALLPGLFEIARRLRREGGWREMDTGLHLTHACLDRLEALGGSAPPIPSAWAPGQDEVVHAQAVAAVQLEQRVSSGRYHASSTAVHPETAAGPLAAELRRQLVEDPTIQAPRGARADRLDALIASLFGPAREEAAALRRSAGDAGRQVLPRFVELRQRWARLVGPLPDGGRPDDD